MRGLAEYVMSGRRQAATVAVLLGLIPMVNLLSGAVVALVTLRKGPREGFLVMMWALLPAGLKWLLGDTSQVIMVVGVTVLAYVLRRTQFWQQTLLLATVLAVLLQLSVGLQTAHLANLQELANLVVQLMQQSGSVIPGAESGLTVEESKAQMIALWLSFYGLEHLLAFTACLVIGRYWQALLYNPGGFRQEFYSLQVDARVMVVLLALIVAGLAGMQPLNDWMLMFFVIPGLCGLAVAHYAIAARKMGTGGLVLTYLIAVVYAPLIVMVGFADRWFDIRKRIKKKD